MIIRYHFVYNYWLNIHSLISFEFISFVVTVLLFVDRWWWYGWKCVFIFTSFFSFFNDYLIIIIMEVQCGEFEVHIYGKNINIFRFHWHPVKLNCFQRMIPDFAGTQENLKILIFLPQIYELRIYHMNMVNKIYICFCFSSFSTFLIPFSPHPTFFT